ncbi:hypothetical protein Airi02_000390 [Actinoallomurus iriomotensis]|uniref:Uncharacterized protein n=1 Tax=Actinoallomurus iriomotensis TaxID=478107 RepID=A0A9W6RXT9_9ACTN|nr:hypothetical protein Airi02_000390 [Actinoallomurus iriomotensis]
MELATGVSRWGLMISHGGYPEAEIVITILSVTITSPIVRRGRASQTENAHRSRAPDPLSGPFPEPAFAA